jgi:DNA polymerase-4
MQFVPVSVLSGRFGNIGRRIWLMAQGKDTQGLILSTEQAKSVSSSKIIPPNTKDKNLLDSYLYYCCDKVATRLREAKLFAKRVSVSLSLKNDHITQRDDYIQATNDESQCYATAKKVLSKWKGEGVYKITVRAEKVGDKSSYQRDLFQSSESSHDRLNKIRDELNTRFGQGTVKTAKLILSPVLNEVIPPSWKPDGSRNCVKSATQLKGDGKKLLKKIVKTYVN